MNHFANCTTVEAIKKLYRTLAMRWHPDRPGGDLETMQIINAQYHQALKAADGTLHPVQQAFIDENAPQCGFCTPGQVMSAVALLRDNPRPTQEEAIHAMSGNLCRCGAYEHYLRGVMRASGQLV